jgi:hypothetical protein
VIRTWTCKKCKARWPRRNAKCLTHNCTGKRPAKRVPKHREIMAVPYERWVEQFGEVCGICGRKPSANRRLDRDHSHREPYGARGLLCHSCNRTLSSQHGITVDWLLNAAKYLDRTPITRL